MIKTKNFSSYPSNVHCNRGSNHYRKRRQSLVRELRIEQLESRLNLSSEFNAIESSTRLEGSAETSYINWFKSFDETQRLPLSDLASIDHSLPLDFIGPVEPTIGEWVVQLTERASNSLKQLEDAATLFKSGDAEFSIITGLGQEGWLLVRGEGSSKAALEASLSQNDSIQSFSLNQLIQGQAVVPNDSDYGAGLLGGLDAVKANEAWELTRGKSTILVGVLDTGVDPTHPDLYLNIWLNQGELPPAFRDKLTDIDNDGLITFYDLNNAVRSKSAPYELTINGFATGPNAAFVIDKNNDGRIDAIDLLRDANWADGRDTDQNGFFDDFFGVNFRAGDGDPFAINNPSDDLGHGTHVAGTIGAIGGNGSLIAGQDKSNAVGINWQTSLMSLRILDNNNQGDSASAILALNYARQMRERYTKVDQRVTAGADIRVLNNSWGQPGGYEAVLEKTIQEIGDVGILFVAAAGNGNFLGEGVDNDRTPFYPASYNSDNVIAVGASNFKGNPAVFSNFGKEAVDLFAPGIGIRSTLPGSRFASINGTSMATPHVSGAAALIWSLLESATVSEVRSAILSNTEPVDALRNRSTSGGFLNVDRAIRADIFSAGARLDSAPIVSSSGGTSYEFTVTFSSRDGIDTSTIGDDDIVVVGQWGPRHRLQARFKPDSLSTSVQDGISFVTATYQLTPPGGSWDALDFGEYRIAVAEDVVKTGDGKKSVRAGEFGSFRVRIIDPSVIYATNTKDSTVAGSLRSAIIDANAASPTPRTIILVPGEYNLSLVGQAISTTSFPFPDLLTGCTSSRITAGWTDATYGDLDVSGNIKIVGDSANTVVIGGNESDRVFKVHTGGTLTLERVTVTGGVSPIDQGGGGILSVGTLSLKDSIVRGNRAVGDVGNLGGGGIAVWSGTTTIDSSRVTSNRADAGGGVYACNGATLTISASTIDNNTATDFGGGVATVQAGPVSVENSTISTNSAADGGAIVNRKSGTIERTMQFQNTSINSDGSFIAAIGSSDIKSAARLLTFGANSSERMELFNPVLISPTFKAYRTSMSADGRFIAFDSLASDLVANDTNNRSDVFVYDRQTATIERISISSNGVQGTHDSFHPSISADGRLVAFESNSDNIDPGTSSNANLRDIFVHDRVAKTTIRVSVDGNDGTGEATSGSSSPSISPDGRFIVYESLAGNLTAGVSRYRGRQVYLRDLNDSTNQATKIVSISNSNEDGDSVSLQPSVSLDGKFVVFQSYASNLVGSDSNGTADVFLRDIAAGKTILVSSNSIGASGTNLSGNPSITPDGSMVVFESLAFDLVGTSNKPQLNFLYNDIFSWDKETQKSVRVSNHNPLSGGTLFDSSSPSISHDGTTIVYAIAPKSGIGLTPTIVRAKKIGAGFTLTDLLAGKETEANFVRMTIAFNRGRSIILGDIGLSSSLVVGSSTVLELDGAARSAGHNIFESIPFVKITPQWSFDATDIADSNASSGIQPLTLVSGVAPVHSLRAESKAIDAGEATLLSEKVDQLGRSRSPRSDIGAVEVDNFSAAGTVFYDRNLNGRRDIDEQGVSDLSLFLDSNRNGIRESNEREFVSNRDLSTTLENEAGQYLIAEIDGDEASLAIELPPGFELPSKSPLLVGRGSETPSVSRDGRYVVVASRQDLLNTSRSNGYSYIYLYDRLLNTYELITSNQNNYNPSISGNGRFIAYTRLNENFQPSRREVHVFDRFNKVESIVSVDNNGNGGTTRSDNSSVSEDGNLVAFESQDRLFSQVDSNSSLDVYLRDRSNSKTRLVSISQSGGASNGDSKNASISGDGRYVVFESLATNIIASDNNTFSDIFLYDVQLNTTIRISKGLGAEADGDSVQPFINLSGTHVVFESKAKNLTPQDTNFSNDIFVYEIATGEIKAVSVNDAGTIANSYSLEPTIDASGRYVSFVSVAQNLTTTPLVGSNAIFVRDLVAGTTRLLSVERDGNLSSSNSSLPTISGNGEFIAFWSDLTRIVDNDVNGQKDIFLAANPLIPQNQRSSIRLSALPGETVRQADFAISVKPGTIRGRVFEETIVNGVSDSIEQGVAGVVVYLDLNDNGERERDEPFNLADQNGDFEFVNLEALRNYSVIAIGPTGFEQAVPAIEDSKGRYQVRLAPNANVSNRDFGFTRIVSSGQSGNSSVSGRVYDDRNNSGKYDAGDVPFAGIEVYVDGANLGVRNENEEIGITDAEGVYSIANLGSKSLPVSVTAIFNPTMKQVTPIGNRFTNTSYPLFQTNSALGNPQSIATADFNHDGFLDIAVALIETDTLSIRLNDRRGGLLADSIDISLGTDDSGPSAMVVGQFDENEGIDVALTAFNSSNVVVLLNYDVGSKSFRSQSSILVDSLPSDIVAGQFDGDAKMDLVVLNRGKFGTRPSVQILTNNGAGGFSAGTAVPTAGEISVSLVAGEFTGDSFTDVFVTHSFVTSPSSPFGTIFSGNGAGKLTPTVGDALVVGARPLDSSTADFNQDNRLDVAVANFGSNTISILLGKVGGGLVVQPSTLSNANGIADIFTADIDGDGDTDVIASNLTDRTISYFRNLFRQTGMVTFEPLSSVALAPIVTYGERMPLVVADFHNDIAKPNSGGMNDVIVATQSEIIHVLKNQSVDGSHRIILNGTNTFQNLDFIVKPTVMLPKLGVIENPSPIFEDDAQQELTISDITPGILGGPALRISTTSSNPELIPSPVVSYIGGSDSATLRYKSNADLSGSSIISVRVTDAGQDKSFGNDDDTFFERSFTVSVISVNDPPTFDLSGNVSVQSGAGLLTRNAFAKGFQPGKGSQESNETIVGYIVGVDVPTLFSILPSINEDGTLFFAPASDRTGLAQVTVQVRDSGGSLNGGQDLSTVKSFTIDVTAIPDASGVDFGDAPSSIQSSFPASYPTLIADNGARHEIGGIYLGSRLDSESDGFSSPNATGDDANRISDEDGIRFMTTLLANSSVSTTATFAAMASLPGQLDAWIDFNQDGDWADEDERIVSNRSVKIGSNLIPFSIPSGADSGKTFARFRISTIGGLNFDGPASDGEVEDYQVELVQTAQESVVTILVADIQSHRLLIENGVVNVLSDNINHFASPLNQIGRIEFRDIDGSVLYSLSNPSISGISEVLFAPTGVARTIRLSGVDVSLSQSISTFQPGLQTLDLSMISGQKLRFSAVDIARLQTDQPFRIKFDSSDTLDTPSTWIFQRSFIELSHLIHVFKSNETVLELEGMQLRRNALNPFDVNGDGNIAPIDVLQIINQLKRNRSDDSPKLPDFDPQNPTNFAFFDVDGSNSLEPIDALQVINALKRREIVPRNAEGEIPIVQMAALLAFDNATRDALVFDDSTVMQYIRENQVPLLENRVNIFPVAKRDSNRPAPRHIPTLRSEAEDIDKVMSLNFEDIFAPI